MLFAICHRLIRRTTIASGAISLAILFAGYAQEEEPEEPSWRAPAPNMATLESSDTSENLDSETSSPAPKLPSAPLPPSIIDPSLINLGVPTDQGAGLPDFSAVQPWFEAEGLRFRVGPAQIRLSLDTSFGYNDNIFAANEPRIGDYITIIAPMIEIGIGEFPRASDLIQIAEETNYFALKYNPSFQYFAINRDQSTVNEMLGMKGRYAFSRLTLDADFSYVTTANPSPADVGRQEYSTYALNLKANYALTQKTFFQLTLSGTYQEYPDISDSQTTTFSVTPALGYQVGPKLKFTLGPVAGITYVGNGGEQPFQAVQAGVTYDTMRKFQLRGTLGVQATQFRGDNPSGTKDFVSPVFSLGATYMIDVTSSATLDLNRTVSTAGTSNGQTYVGTAAILGYRKKFLTRVLLETTGSLQTLDYQGGDERTDTYFFFTLKVGYLFWQNRCNAYVVYTRSQRLSDNTTFEYEANSIGSGISVQF